MRQRSIHVAVDTRGPVPAYVQIMDQIRDRVREGELPVGTPLPSVRELAGRLDLNPNTVAKAYAFLEREGTLQTVARRGTFVARENSEAEDRRVEETASRLLAEAESRGIDADRLLEALRRRLEGRGPGRKRRRR